MQKVSHQHTIVVNVELSLRKYRVGIASALLLMSSIGIAVPANAGGTYDPELGNGTVACSLGGVFTVEEYVVIGSLDCKGHAAVPESIEQIDTESFYGATDLKSISIPSSVTSIGPQAFIASGLTSVSFAQNSRLASIGRSAFAETKLTTITIPSSVLHVYDGAFTSTNVLKHVTFSKGSQLISIGDMAFYYSGLTSIKIPASVSTIGKGAFQNSQLQSVIFEENSEMETLVNDVFMSAKSLNSIEFGKNSKLKWIMYDSFYNTDLKQIVIPKSVVYLDNDAFKFTRSLSKIYFLGNAPRINNEFSAIGACESDRNGCIDSKVVAKAYIKSGATGFAKLGKVHKGLVVTKMPATALVKPRILGTTKVNQILSLNKGEWVGYTNPKITYAWYACTKQVTGLKTTVPKTCKKITGATKSTFKIARAQKGKFISALVTGVSAGTSKTTWLTKSTSKVS
jgi:hypothetical protein